MEVTIDDVMKAAMDKGYQPMFPEPIWDKAVILSLDNIQYLEISCIMIWLHVKHKNPVADLTVIKHRMNKDREGVLSEIQQKIVSLN